MVSPFANYQGAPMAINKHITPLKILAFALGGVVMFLESVNQTKEIKQAVNDEMEERGLVHWERSPENPDNQK